MTKALSYNEFAQLVNRIDQKNPSPEDLLAIRKALARNPEVIAEISNLAKHAQNSLLNGQTVTPVGREFSLTAVRELEHELDYENAPVLERLVMDQVLLCYLRLNMLEHAFSSAESRTELNWKQIQEWEKWLGSSQRRYLRAVESLARIRRLGISIQVNIATEGGQQINVNQQ